MSDAIRDALLGSLLTCIVSLELADDDLVDPGAASGILDEVVSELDNLGDPDRELLASLVRRRAAAEEDPDRREILEALPEELGLLDA